MSSDFNLDGLVALVTGGSSGIGAAIAVGLAGAGAKVVITARRSEELQGTVQAIVEGGGRAEAVVADLARLSEVEALASAAARPFGSPDVLVNAAGINLREPVDRISHESWNRTLALHLSAPFFLARALVPEMRRRGWGRIINIASLQTVRAMPDCIAYGTAKGGVGQMTRAMAEAWSGSGINCNALAPGFFPTELTAPVFADAERAAKMASQTAIGRNGRLEDLHGPAIFLASRASDYVTGQVIYIDGGFTAK